MKITFGVSAADVARARWRELVARESPIGAIGAGLVTVATLAPLLTVVARTSMVAWAVALPLCAAGIGVGMRRLASSVTARYGVAASFATAACGLLSLWLFECGPQPIPPRLLTAGALCFTGISADLTLVAAACAVAMLVGFFAGFRQVRASELLPPKR